MISRFTDSKLHLAERNAWAHNQSLYLVGLKDRTERIRSYSLKINNFYVIDGGYNKVITLTFCLLVLNKL